MSGYGPMISANRLVRIRVPSGMGAGGENPSATRQGALLFVHDNRPIGIFLEQAVIVEELAIRFVANFNMMRQPFFEERSNFERDY